MNERNRSDSLLEMAKGAILERVDYEAARVAENIEDPNTDFKAEKDPDHADLQGQRGSGDGADGHGGEDHLGAHDARQHQSVHGAR